MITDVNDVMEYARQTYRRNNTQTLYAEIKRLRRERDEHTIKDLNALNKHPKFAKREGRLATMLLINVLCLSARAEELAYSPERALFHIRNAREIQKGLDKTAA
jgi:hypothetical protein